MENSMDAILNEMDDFLLYDEIRNFNYGDHISSSSAAGQVKTIFEVKQFTSHLLLHKRNHLFQFLHK